MSEPALLPWSYGRFRMVVTRRVTEEEQISIECYEGSRETAIETFELFLQKCREHMIAHNERIVMAHRDQLNKLQRIIEQREQELMDLDQELEEKRKENGHALDPG